jgi:excisionase family DNA binding protein
VKFTTERLLTTAEAAELLRVSQASVRRWSDSGLLRARRVGRRGERRFSEPDLAMFLNSGADPKARAATDAAVNVGGVPLAVPSHIVTLFSTDASELRLTVPFFADGLRLGQPCLLVANGPASKRYANALKKQRDVDYPRALGDGQFKVVKFKGGTASSAIAEWEDAFARILAERPTVIRVVGEMATERAMFLSEDEMLAYEEAFEVMYKRYPVVVICQYDVRAFTGVALLRALKAHPGLFGHRIGSFLN